MISWDSADTDFAFAHFLDKAGPKKLDKRLRIIYYLKMKILKGNTEIELFNPFTKYTLQGT